MLVIPDPAHVVLSQLDKGSLGLVANGQIRFLALGMTGPSDTQRSVCLLPLGPNEQPRIQKVGPSERLSCLDFGPDWVLRFEMADVSWPGDGKAYETYGALHLTSDGPVMNALSFDGYGFKQLAYVNLKTAEYTEHPYNGWPVKHWSIWLSEDARPDRGAKALYEWPLPDSA